MVTTSLYGLTLLLLCLMLLHILVIGGLIPYRNLWGGKLKTKGEMYRAEPISLLITIVLLGVLLKQLDLINLPITWTVVRVMLWLMTLIFVGITILNFLSENQYERFLFAPLSLLMTVFSFILAVQ